MLLALATINLEDFLLGHSDIHVLCMQGIDYMLSCYCLSVVLVSVCI